MPCCRILMEFRMSLGGVGKCWGLKILENLGLSWRAVACLGCLCISCKIFGQLAWSGTAVGHVAVFRGLGICLFGARPVLGMVEAFWGREQNLKKNLFSEKACVCRKSVPINLHLVFSTNLSARLSAHLSARLSARPVDEGLKTVYRPTLYSVSWPGDVCITLLIVIHGYSITIITTFTTTRTSSRIMSHNPSPPLRPAAMIATSCPLLLAVLVPILILCICSQFGICELHTSFGIWKSTT